MNFRCRINEFVIVIVIVVLFMGSFPPCGEYFSPYFLLISPCEFFSELGAPLRMCEDFCEPPPPPDAAYCSYLNNQCCTIQCPVVYIIIVLVSICMSMYLYSVYIKRLPTTYIYKYH